MSAIVGGFEEALRLIVTADPRLVEIVGLSLAVSGTAVVLAAAVGVPLGAWLGLRRGRAVRWAARFLYTLMGLPPVVAGLVVYLLISSRGPFGVLDLLFTPAAMVIAQWCLATPIVAGLTMVGVKGVDRAVRDTAVSLGADERQAVWAVVREARPAIVGAVVAGFGRVVAEVGAVMIVGGNIEGHTRVMTTAIVLETRRGNFDLAIGLGIVLLAVAFVFNSVFHRLQGEVDVDER